MLWVTRGFLASLVASSILSAVVVGFALYSNPYVFVDFRSALGYEYAELLHTVSAAVDGPVPFVYGFEPESSYRYAVSVAVSNYTVIDMAYSWLVAGRLAEAFMALVLPSIIVLHAVAAIAGLQHAVPEANLQLLVAMGARGYAVRLLATPLVVALVTALPVVVVAAVLPWLDPAGALTLSLGLVATVLLVAGLSLSTYIAAGFNPAAYMGASIAAAMAFMVAPQAVAAALPFLRLLAGGEAGAATLVMVVLANVAAYYAAYRLFMVVEKY